MIVFKLDPHYLWWNGFFFFNCHLVVILVHPLLLLLLNRTASISKFPLFLNIFSFQFQWTTVIKEKLKITKHFRMINLSKTVNLWQLFRPHSIIYGTWNINPQIAALLCKCHLELVILKNEYMNLKRAKDVHQPYLCEIPEARFRNQSLFEWRVF